MRRFVQIRTMCMSVIIVLACTLLCSAAYYRVFSREVLEDLAAYTRLLGEGIPLENDANLEGIARKVAREEIRLTVINENGVVMYDNAADAAALENHFDRVEIRDALDFGEGHAMRRSRTIHEMTLYYAVALSDGSVLRTARQTRSYYGIFLHALPIVVIFSAILLWVCYLFGRSLTKGLLRPIQAFSEKMDAPEPDGMYPELRPIIHHIQDQHAQILESAARRQEFTANVSHELKTPLTVISGYAQLLENGMANPEDEGRFLREIGKNADRLLNLIDDTLRLSELDSTFAGSSAGVHPVPVHLYQAAESCAEMLEPVCSQYQVQMRLAGSDAVVLADRKMVDELLYNLCDNAIRYNRPGGHVTVTVGEAFLRVSDDGIGIPAEYQQRVFERFFRVDKSRSKKTGGTGLGLAIVKHIVQILGADIRIESEVDQGTSITVTFPEGRS